MANVTIKVGYKDAAFFAANPTLVLAIGQLMYLEQTGTYKIGDGVTALSALSFLGAVSGVPSFLQSPDALSVVITEDGSISSTVDDGVGTVCGTYTTINGTEIIDAAITVSTPLMVDTGKRIKTLTAAVWGAFIVALTGKTTPVNADSIMISDSAATGTAKKVTLTNFKSFLKTYFDTLYATIVSVPTKTSDLINDGDNGTTHFISLEDLPSNIILYPTNVASAIPGYFKTVASITDPDYNTVAVDISTGTITTTAQLISSLSAPIGLIVGNPGIFNITTLGNIKRVSGSGTATFYFEVYHRTAAGVESLIATSSNTLAPTLSTYVEFSATAIWNDGIFAVDDLAVIKLYANRVGAGTNPVYNFQFGGTTPVRTLVPVPLTVTSPITQTITNGDTLRAPSGDAVYDALAILNNFRLSLTTAISVTTTDVVNAKTIYCIPHNGNKISLYDGTNWITYSPAEFSLALGTLTAGNYDVFCYANAGVPTLEFLAWTDDVTRATLLTQLNGIDVKVGDSTRRYLGTFVNLGNKTSTVTISNATPSVITYTGHTLTANAPVVFTTTGALPSGLVAGTTYYLASLGTSTSNTFNVSATPGGALINTTTAGSGTHTCTVLTYTEDSEANRCLWNNNNQVPRRMYANENTASWTYTTATYRQVNANKLNQLNFVTGKTLIVSAEATNRASNTLAFKNIVLSIGLDSTTTSAQNTDISIFSQVASANGYQYLNPVFLNTSDSGRHYLSILEYSEASGTTTWSNGAIKACKITGLLLG